MKIAVITGASSGIGREFVKQLDAEGLDELWVIARRKERLTALQTDCKTAIRPLALDLTEEANFDKIAELLSNDSADVRFLVNASGFGKYGTCEDLTREEINGMLNLNVRAVIEVTRAVLPFMQRGARIINIGSSSAFQPLPYFAMYAASKACIVSYSRALNVELRERKISVTSVCPGYVRTEFFKVAHDTKNPDTCKNFTPLYEPEDVVRKAIKDAKRGKDLSVLGFVTNFRRIGAKLLPSKTVINTWLRIR